MDMPILKPIPIKTKHKSIFVRAWRWITSIRKWELVEDWEYKLPGNVEPVIVVPKGFVFDGASIPKVLWGLLSPTGLLLVPGLVHDFAYRYDYLWAVNQDREVYKYQANVGQKHWDDMFKRVGLSVNGMSIIDSLAWVTLAAFGKMAWKTNRKRNDAEIMPNLPLASIATEPTSQAEVSA